MDEIALSEQEYEFLRRVCCGLPLRLADRKEDRARQKVRKMGLVEVVMEPRRWVATFRGKAWLAALSNPSQPIEEK